MAVSKQYSSGTLAAISSVIGILAGLYFGTLKLYNHGLELKSRQPYPEEPPSSTSTIVDTITKRMGRPKKDPNRQEVD